jgi:hypothetical protein
VDLAEAKKMVGKQPITKFKCGSIEAAVFENEVTKGVKTFSVRKVVFQKNYLDRNDKWQSTSSLDLNYLPKAILALSKAYEFLAMTEKQGD